MIAIPPSECRWARQVSAVLLIAVVVLEAVVAESSVSSSDTILPSCGAQFQGDVVHART